MGCNRLQVTFLTETKETTNHSMCIMAIFIELTATKTKTERPFMVKCRKFMYLKNLQCKPHVPISHLQFLRSGALMSLLWFRHMSAQGDKDTEHFPMQMQSLFKMLASRSTYCEHACSFIYMLHSTYMHSSNHRHMEPYVAATQPY